MRSNSDFVAELPRLIANTRWVVERNGAKPETVVETDRDFINRAWIVAAWVTLGDKEHLVQDSWGDKEELKDFHSRWFRKIDDLLVQDFQGNPQNTFI